MSDYVFAFHFLCWNQGPFLSQYHTFWERLGQLWCLESRAQGHPVIRNHGETICYRQLANCFGRVTAVGDIHVSITRNVADPQSCGNHWCEAIAKPCAIENWPIVLAEWQPLETFMQQAKSYLLCFHVMNIHRHWKAYFAGPDNYNSTLIQSTTLWTRGPCLTIVLPSTFCVEIRAPFYHSITLFGRG